MSNQYNVYVSSSRISWREPSAEIYLVWAAVFVPESEDVTIRTTVEELTSGIPDLRQHLSIKSGKRVDNLISSLSEVLGRCRYIADEIPLQTMIEPDDAFASALPEILTRIDQVVSAVNARAHVHCNDMSIIFEPRPSSITGIVMTSQTGGLLLADFAEWTRGYHLWQTYMFRHFEGMLSEFQTWMIEYPLLGSHHKLGRKLLRAIRKAPIVHLDQSMWVRGREVSKEKPNFTSDDMWAPPPERTSEGRYNHMGKPVLYLASDRSTCGAELVEPGEEKTIWMQSFAIHDKTVLDLTAVFDPKGEVRLGDQQLLVSALQGVVTQAAQRDNNWKPEYYIPRFIADIARMLRRYDGIRYSSQRGSGTNLALFHWDHGVTSVGEPSNVFVSRAEIEFPPWQRNISEHPCPYCGEPSSELVRTCSKCGEPNPFFRLDDDI